ncbi:hypothetical protein [Bdellovibrio sp. HCB337]|uniref:hypothetical protein n=1 Tax=Bdellovibrio sp. HCB337 TaxID=3394358 RepID=UPI0039A4D0FE
MKNLFFTFAGLIFSLSSSAALKTLDGQETHGGNVILAEFWSYHNQVTATFNACPRSIENPLVNTWLKQVVQTEIKTQPQVFVGANNEQEVVALNMPKRNPPLILISETKWPALSSLEKIKIVMHETLPVLGVTDDDYIFSGQLFDSYKNCTSPKYSEQEILFSFLICNKASIEKLEGADILSLNPAKAMTIATYTNCLPAVRKLQDYGGSLKLCYGNHPTLSAESPLQTFIFSYRDRNPNYPEFFDFLMNLDTSELVTDCDSDFAKACTLLKKNMSAYPAKASDLSKLGQKIGCSL